MKTKIYLFFFLLVLTGNMFAQGIPQGFMYRGVARNSTGVALANEQITVTSSIYTNSSGTGLVYSETHDLQTNNSGEFFIRVGMGDQITSNSFSDVDWLESNYYMGIEYETSAGVHTDLGIGQLMSVPYSIVSEKLALPYSDETSGSTGFSITNSSPVDNSAAIRGIMNNDQRYSGTGVYGRSENLSGKGVYGTCDTYNGTGVYGSSANINGVGVYASNFSGGKALVGQSGTNGTSGHFSGGKVVINNSPVSGSNLEIQQSAGQSPATLRIQSNNPGGRYWQVDALNNSNASSEGFTIRNSDGEKFKIKGDGKIIFNGPLMPNNISGTAGQVLTSTGNGTAPVWSSVSNVNSILVYDQLAPVNITNTASLVFPVGVFNVSSNSYILLNFSHSNIQNAYYGGDSKIKFTIKIFNNVTNTYINEAEMVVKVPNNDRGNVSYMHHCYLGNGQYRWEINAQVISGDQDITAVGLSTPNISYGQVSLQIIPQ